MIWVSYGYWNAECSDHGFDHDGFRIARQYYRLGINYNFANN